VKHAVHAFRRKWHWSITEAVFHEYRQQTMFSFQVVNKCNSCQR